jgi:nitrate/nitrite transporter NarK
VNLPAVLSDSERGFRAGLVHRAPLGASLIHAPGGGLRDGYGAVLVTMLVLCAFSCAAVVVAGKAKEGT